MCRKTLSRYVPCMHFKANVTPLRMQTSQCKQSTFAETQNSIFTKLLKVNHCSNETKNVKMLLFILDVLPLICQTLLGVSRTTYHHDNTVSFFWETKYFQGLTRNTKWTHFEHGVFVLCEQHCPACGWFDHPGHRIENLGVENSVVGL